MKIKVCGMKYPDNIEAIVKMNPDYLGFIFYEKSPRFVGDSVSKSLMESIPNTIKKVAVFVNAPIEKVVQTIQDFGFDYAQVHGDENSEYCAQLKNYGIKIIKAFGIDEQYDFSKLEDYKPYCDFFLFDTRGIQYGGNGFSFNWKVLERYDNKKSFFLSGGIGPENIEEAVSLEDLNIEALDLNSKFEIEPGVKDEIRIKSAKCKIEN